MFDPKEEVPSLELCRKLKELDYPQEKYGFWWVKYDADPDWYVDYWDEEHIRWRRDGKYILLGGCDCCAEPLDIEEKIKAPTARELGIWLPNKIEDKFYLSLEKGERRWFTFYSDYKNEEVYQSTMGETIAESFAKMLIWLIENGHVRFENRRER